MPRKSREHDLIALFYNYPTKHWRFKELEESVPIAANKISKWLKKFVAEGLVQRVSVKGKMPYYIGAFDSPAYKTSKRLFAFTEMYKSGLLNQLIAAKGVKTAIIFGSMTRTDWHFQSDVDLFIYGKNPKIKTALPERYLHKEIQIFVCERKKDLSKYSNELLRNITKGWIIKGDLDFLEVRAID